MYYYDKLKTDYAIYLMSKATKNKYN